MSLQFPRLISAFLLLILNPVLFGEEKNPTLVLSAPLDWQVSQRQTVSEGIIGGAGQPLA